MSNEGGEIGCFLGFSFCDISEIASFIPLCFLYIAILISALLLFLYIYIYVAFFACSLFDLISLF